MTWDNEFAALTKKRRNKAVQERRGAPLVLDQGVADRERAESHIKNVVMPLFNEVADAARKRGYFGTTEMILVQAVNDPGGKEAPFVMGALLGLSRTPPIVPRQWAGAIKLVHTSGAIFALSHRAPDFNRTDGASIDDLNPQRLTAIVREVIASTFG